MYVSGFMCVRNAVKYDYPLSESIQSILPLVDELVIALGDCQDGTVDVICRIPSSINQKKIRIIHTVWDESFRKNGKVLALETDKAMDGVNSNADWLIYIQADEVIHEKYTTQLKQAMQMHLDNKRIDGLLMNYTHFYGDYQYVANSRLWYNKEVRIIRNNKNIRSYKDAQGFRMRNGKKLRVKETAAKMYHYGWVRNPKNMQQKIAHVNLQYLTGKNVVADETIRREAKKDAINYHDYIDSLAYFQGTHPNVMRKRIQEKNWNFHYDISKKKFKNKKYQFLYWIEQKTGYRPFTHNNYVKV